MKKKIDVEKLNNKTRKVVEIKLSKQLRKKVQKIIKKSQEKFSGISPKQKTIIIIKKELSKKL